MKSKFLSAFVTMVIAVAITITLEYFGVISVRIALAISFLSVGFFIGKLMGGNDE